VDMIANFAPGLWTPGTPRIPVTLYAIITEHQQKRERKDRVGSSLTDMD